MSETVQLALIAAIAPTLAVLAGLWMAWLNLKKDAAATATKTAEKLDVIATDAKIVKAHVNSEATRAQGEKVALEKENAILREVITKQDGDKQLLAQAMAGRVRAPDSVASEAEAPKEKE
jgi:hypothetical protein